MWVLTSKDGGATFGAPVDTTVPGEQTYADLQCADSGGPSNLFVNQKTGRVFAVYGTRSSQVPLISGCTAQPVAVNVVPATRTWVTYSDTPDVEGSWKQTLAVDDSAIPLIEGQQLSPLALDNQGNAYLVYAEGLPGGDYTGVIKYVWAPADLSKWSAPITVTPVRGAGHVLPHVVAGDPGKVDFAYMTGVQQGSSDPLWYSTVAQTLDGMDPQPTFSEVRIGQFPSFGGTDGALMGACGSGPTAGVQNGFFCSRSSDIYGVALDAQCNLLVSWPAKDTIIGGPNDGKAIPGAQPNTYISKQTGGTPVCAVSAASTAPAPVASSATLPNTAGGLAPAFLVAPSAALLGLLFATRRRPA